jgi:transposase
MARIGRPPKALLIVTEEERDILECYVRRGRANRSLAFRARIILGCTNSPGSTVARALRTTNQTVCKWRNRFIKHRLDGLLDEPRPGADRTVTVDQVEAVVVKTLESTPMGRTHWSTRAMAKNVGLSHTTIGRIWRTFGLKPHATKDFGLSNDPLLIEKVRDIVGLYMSPPDNAVVVCVEEVADPGAVASDADLANGPGSSGAADTQLPAPWDNGPLCGARRQDREGCEPPVQQASRQGVHHVCQTPLRPDPETPLKLTPPICSVVGLR